jgi:effector-binding domain-containing protein
VTVALVQTHGTPTAVVAETTTWQAYPSLWPQYLDEVWTFLRGSDLGPGRNVMVYRDDRPRVEVERPFAPHGRVVASTLPAGVAAKTIAHGAPSREGLAAAHAAVKEWCATNGHELDGTHWEIYDHEPASYTEVYWLVSDHRSPT